MGSRATSDLSSVCSRLSFRARRFMGFGMVMIASPLYHLSS
jgi:hypothetical protein